MNKLILPLFLLAFQLHAAPRIEFEWGPSPDSDVINYRLKWGANSGNYSAFRDVGNITNFIFTNITIGVRQFFVVTAQNFTGEESDPSNELNFLVPIKPRPPGELKVRQILQSASTVVGPWRDIGTLESIVPATEPSQFFRVVLNVEPPPIP